MHLRLIWRLGGAGLILLALAGCADKNQYTERNVIIPPLKEEKPKIDPLALSLDRYLNKRDGKDCSGFVSLINKENGNLYFDEALLNSFFTTKNKSQAIYNLYKKNGKTFTEGVPQKGDLVFFVNTFKGTFNRKKSDQNITHVGIVREVAEDGTVRFFHNSAGINQESFMNLRLPNLHKLGEKEVNSYIIRCPKNANPLSCLTSTRFIGYGKIPLGTTLSSK